MDSLSAELCYQVNADIYFLHSGQLISHNYLSIYDVVKFIYAIVKLPH